MKRSTQLSLIILLLAPVAIWFSLLLLTELREVVRHPPVVVFENGEEMLLSDFEAQEIERVRIHNEAVDFNIGLAEAVVSGEITQAEAFEMLRKE